MVQSPPPLGKRQTIAPTIYDPSDHHTSGKSRKKAPTKPNKKPTQYSKAQHSNAQHSNAHDGSMVPSKSVIQRKIQAAHRQDKVTLLKTGGGTVVSFNAGSYEIYKRVLSDAFTQATGLTLEGRYIQSHSSAPQETASQYTSSIKVSSQDTITLEVASYTINFYHSKCKILVNGRDEAQFQFDLKLVLNNISRKQEYGSLPSDECMNDAIKCILESELQPVDEGNSRVSREQPESSVNAVGKVKNTNTSWSPPVPVEIPNNRVCAVPGVSTATAAQLSTSQPISTTTVAAQSTPLAASIAPAAPQPTMFQPHIPPINDISNRLELISLDHNIPPPVQICKTCNKQAKTRCIMCQSCNKIVHLRCEKITNRVIQQEILDSGTYRCVACSPGAIVSSTAGQPVNSPDINASGSNDMLIATQVATLSYTAQPDNTHGPPIVTFPEDEGTNEADHTVTYLDSRDTIHRDSSSTHHDEGGSSEASGGQQTPDSGQGVSELEERLKLCQNMELENRKKEKQLQKWEDKLKIRERCTQDKQEDLAKAQAYIIKLEAKIKDLENSLKIARMAQPLPTTPVPPPQTLYQPHPHHNTQPYNTDPFEFTKQACTTLEYKLKAEMNEKMLNMMMREPSRLPPQPPVTVIPMMLPMVLPQQQVYAPPRRRGSYRSAGPSGRPSGTVTPPYVPPVVPMSPPAPQVPSTTAPMAPPRVPPVIPMSPPAPQVPLNPVPMASPHIAGTPYTAPVTKGVPPQTTAPLVSHPGPATHPNTPLLAGTALTTNTMVSQAPRMAYTAPMGAPTASQPPTIQVTHAAQPSFLTHPGLSNHPSWTPVTQS